MHRRHHHLVVARKLAVPSRARPRLAGDAGAQRQTPARKPPPAAAPLSPVEVGAIVTAILFVIMLLIVSPGFRAFLWSLFELFLLGDSSGGGSSSGGSSGGGSGYSGGGGSTGGGGSGEDY